jgi:hypothetical protein
MGFFGSSHKTFYTSVTSKLFEDVAGVVKQTTVSAIMQNRNIAADLKANLVNGMGAQANRLYNYGKSGNYPWGLPDGASFTLSPDSPLNIKRIIEKELNQPIEIGYCSVDTDPETSHIIYEAEYYLVDANGNIEEEASIWTYDERTGVYPILNLDIDDLNVTSPYFPIIPLYEDQQSLIATGQPNRVAIKNACKYLGVDANQISESIAQQGLTKEEVDNGDTPDNPMEDAFIVLGVEIANDTPVGKRYIFDYFQHQKGVNKVTKEDFIYWETNNKDTYEGETTGNSTTTITYYTSNPPVNLVNLSDANYQMELGWLYIEDQVIEGTIGKVGTHDVVYIEEGHGWGSNGTSLKIGRYGSTYFSTSSLTLRKQITVNQYIEMEVVGLTYSNWAVGHEVRTTLKDAFDDPDDIDQTFIVPLRRDLLAGMGATQTHDLLYTAIRLVVNDRNRVRIKWYQQGWFQIVMIVVAVVATAMGAPEVGALLMSAEFWIVTVAKILITKILMEATMPMLEDVLGKELALLVQVIATYFMGGGASGAAFATANAAISLYGEYTLENIQEDIDKINELLEDMNEEENERIENLTNVRTWLSGDPYNMLAADTHVKMFKYESKLPTLIRATTEHFTDMMKFTDRPSSYIRLGV